MAFYNQGGRPGYLSSIQPVQFRNRAVDLDKTHGHFVGTAISYLSEIRKEDFRHPRALWEKVFDDGAKQRFIETVSGHMSNCRKEEIIKRQIGIFREVSEDLASRLEKATGVKGYDGISSLRFNGTHNGLAKDPSLRVANGQNNSVGVRDHNNGAPVSGSHKDIKSQVNVNGTDLASRN